MAKNVSMNRSATTVETLQNAAAADGNGTAVTVTGYGALSLQGRDVIMNWIATRMGRTGLQFWDRTRIVGRRISDSMPEYFLVRRGGHAPGPRRESDFAARSLVKGQKLPVPLAPLSARRSLRPVDAVKIKDSTGTNIAGTMPTATPVTINGRKATVSTQINATAAGLLLRQRGIRFCMPANKSGASSIWYTNIFGANGLNGNTLIIVKMSSNVVSSKKGV